MLFVDSDGVVADFNERWYQFYSQDAETLKEKRGKEQLWQSVKNYDPDFFFKLKPMSGAFELLESVRKWNPVILTGSPTEWGYRQKFDWFQKHFPWIPVIVCKSKEKHFFCQPGDILLDDRLKYAHLWEEVGGIFVHHTDWRSSLEKLEKLYDRLPQTSHWP